MLRSGVVIAFLALIAAAESSETLSDYARVKSAPCEQQCTRATLGFGSPAQTFPNKGVVIMSDGFLSQSARWEIVDFEKATAAILLFRRNPADSKSSSAKTVARTTLSQEQVSEAIRIANKIWSRKWAGPARQKTPRVAPMCSDIINELILFDGARTLVSTSTCPFSEDGKQGWNVEEAKLENWFDALFPQPPTPPAAPN